jgi:transposase
MPHALSNDLRERVVGFIEAGHSCHEASRHFKTSVSFAVNLMALYRETGSVGPRAMGGKRHGKLDAVEAFLLTSVKRSPDMTMPGLAAALLAEKGIAVSPQSLSRWLINKGFSFKKNTSGKRARQA